MSPTIDGGASTAAYWLDHWRRHAEATAGADPQAQVQRTWQGRPMSAEQFEAIVDWVLSRLRPEADCDVLDLCCGNGAITHHLARRCRQVLGVDFARTLLDQVDRGAHPNLEVLQSDIRACDFPEDSFDRVLLYAGLQYLDLPETVVLLREVRRWLRPGGRVLLGDIPDADRMWDFFDSAERRSAYFAQLAGRQPLIGTWFSPQWLTHLGRDCGFDRVEVLRQPSVFPFGHFRFELLLA